MEIVWMTVAGAGATKEPSSEELLEGMEEGTIGAEGEAKGFWRIEEEADTM